MERQSRPRLVLPAGVLIAEMVKRYANRRVMGVARRVVQGVASGVQARLAATQGQDVAVINTAFVARLNATFCAHLTDSVRRTRAATRRAATVEAGMWLVGTCYNLCSRHDSLRRPRRATDPPGSKSVERIPAQAEWLTAHRWSMHELLTFCVPPAIRRGRRPRWLREVALAT